MLTPLVSIITSVGLDHVAQLGTTLEAIAFQKAGIIKRGVPVVSGVVQPGPRAVVRAIAAEERAPLVELGEGIAFEYAPPDVVSVRGHAPMRLGLLGKHQAANATLAVAALERLAAVGFHIPAEAMRLGFQRVKWPARIEYLGGNPVRILDCAHNVPSAEALVATLAETFPTVGRKACVFAVSNDKPYAEMLRVLAGYFDDFHFTTYGQNPRCVPPEQLLAFVPGGTLHASAVAAWDAATRGKCELVCATGSVFLAGELEAARRGRRGEPRA